MVEVKKKDYELCSLSFLKFFFYPSFFLSAALSFALLDLLLSTFSISVGINGFFVRICTLFSLLRSLKRVLLFGPLMSEN